MPARRAMSWSVAASQRIESVSVGDVFADIPKHRNRRPCSKAEVPMTLSTATTQRG